MSEYIINEQEEDELQSGSSLSLRAILELTWALRYWIILSIFVCLCCAAAYLYVKPKTYHSAALVMVTTDKNAGMGSSAQMSFIADMTGMQNYNSLTNEKIIIKSTPVLQAVVGELGLNVRYFVFNHWVNRETMPQEVRMTFTGVDSLNLNKLPTFRIDYDIVDVSSLKVSVRRLYGSDGESIYVDKVVKFGEDVPLMDWGTLRFNLWDEARPRFQGNSYDYFTSGKHYIMLYSPQTRARELARQIGVEVMEDQSSRMSTSSILQLMMRDIHPERSEKVLDKMIEKYNELTKTYYMTSNAKTMEFIDNRLQDLSGDLSELEGNIQQFSTKNRMVDLESQAKLTLNTDATAAQQLQEVDVQLALLEMIAKELKTSQPYTVLPSNVGLSDPSIVGFITNYNTACIERARLVAGSSEKSPVVQRLSKQIADLGAVIEKSVTNQQTSLKLQRKELSRQMGRSKDYLSSVPGQKIDLAQIERERSVIEPLYVLLQKKREETMLTIVAEPDIARIVEYPENNSVLVGPNARQVFLVAIVTGFLLPLIIVYLLMLMKTKVQGPDDISSRTRVPLLGVVPRREGNTFRASEMAEKGSSGSSSVLSEAMRTIRTNIGFMSGKVLQFTSSIPGEGKSFVSANVAISLCSIGKKVILVETDLRKGRQHRLFELSRNRAAGLSNYLSGEIEDWHKAVTTVEQFPGLDLLLKGGVPPNPNELLSGDRFGVLIESLRKEYDYIILDSPPYLVIADPMTLNKYVDRNIYVVRSGKSDLRFINEIDSAAKTAKLNNVTIILNDVQMSGSKAKYGYGYGYNYGYGYGYRYGYGYGYNNEENGQNRGLRSRLRDFFSKKK